MSETPDVALWPSRENYAWFRSLCDDDVPESFDEFEVAATAQLAAMAREGIFIKRIAFNPDMMAAWCRAKFGNVDSYARSCYAGFLALSD